MLKRKSLELFTGDIGFVKKILTSLSLDVNLYLREDCPKTPNLNHKGDSHISRIVLSKNQFSELLIDNNLSNLYLEKGFVFSVVYENYYFAPYLEQGDISSFLKEDKFLILDRVQDVRNFGSLCRIAVWAGIKTIIVSQKGSAPVNTGVLESSSGYLLQLKVLKTNLKSIISVLKERGYAIIASVARDGEILWDFDVNSLKKWALIIGNERYGIRDNILQLSTHQLTIPLYERVESLNLSVAAGIILADFLKKEETKRFKK